ncbi:MAG TPA: alanine racemase [Ignavibacteria bacterium]|nr:alanine racemase [Ignavibacteria bacterium]
MNKNTEKKNNKKSLINDTYAEINLNILEKNFRSIKKHVNPDSNSNVKICSIIKANAYGHGMNETGKALAEYGTDFLGTADYSESVCLSDHLKKHAIKTPVLCLGILSEKSKYYDEIISRNIEVSIDDIISAGYLNDYAKSKNKKVKIHIQVDSGINRTGFQIKDAFEAFRKLNQMKNLEIKGIYSHYATSDLPSNGYALRQSGEFKELIKNIEHNIKKIELKHISNSGGILNYPDKFFNMVRPGLTLYGYYPGSKKYSIKDRKTFEVNPVMTLKSRVSFLKTLNKDQSISYGRNYFTKRRTKIASIPIGYGDGYSRLFTNKSRVMINGKLYKTVGTVCMDWIMVDLGFKSEVKLNDEVILFGREYPVEILSGISGTIPYEIICNVSARVQRVYVN